MTAASLDIEARLEGSSFALRERVPLVVVLRNPGPDIVIVPDPSASKGDILVLTLRLPDGTERRLPLNETPLPPGALRQELNLPVLPGEDTVFRFNVAALFELLAPGDHAVTVEYTWAPREKPAKGFRSAPLPFTLRRPAEPLFFEVVPAESASLGFQAIVWAEPGSGTLLYDEGPRVLDPFGARVVVAGAGSEPAVSMAPAGLPQMDRWLVSIEDGRSLSAAFATEEPGGSVPPRATALPSGCRGGRLVLPALADVAASVDVEPAPPPPVAVGLLTDGAGGGTDLVIADIDASANAVFSRPIAMSADVASGDVLFVRATAPGPGTRIFVLALPASGGFLVRGVAVQAGAAAPPAAVDLARIDGDELLLGDLRSDLAGRVWIGLLVRRGSLWARVSFTPPVTDPDKDVRTEEMDPGPGARPTAIRLDTAGRLHVVHRSAGLVQYVPPGSKVATWSSARAFARGSREHIVLRGQSPALLLFHDIEQGLGHERMG